MKYFLFLPAAALAAALAAQSAFAQEAHPSFDCEKAGNAAEKAICQNELLKMMDRTMARLYRPARKAGGRPVAATQRKWMKARNACKDEYACLREKYTSRIILLARAAGDDAGVSGVYTYDMPREPSWGRMWLVRSPDGTLSGSLETVTGPTAHTCNIDFEKAVPKGAGWLWTNPDPSGDQEEPCKLTITPVKGGVKIDGTNGCYDFCGARGYFTTTYTREK